MKQLDRKDQEAAVRSAADEEPFDARERTIGDPHALSFVEIRMGQNRRVDLEQPLQRLDLRVGDRREPIPAFTTSNPFPAS